MNNFDFELDVQKAQTNDEEKQGITSIILCTSGCVTGLLMGCANRSATCNCGFHF